MGTDAPRAVLHEHPQRARIERLGAWVRRISHEALEAPGGAGHGRIERALRQHGPIEGLALVGVGGDRAVYALSDVEVVKVRLWPGLVDGQHLREAEVWAAASAEEATWLCPVRAVGDGWSVMARARPFEGTAGPDGRRVGDFRRFTFDTGARNLGVLDGRTVLVDYGMGPEAW